MLTGSSPIFSDKRPPALRWKGEQSLNSSYAYP